MPPESRLQYETRKRALFEAALRRPAQDRQRYVLSECRDDRNLGEAVLRLLSAGSSPANDLLETPIHPRRAIPSPLPKAIGQYKVIRQLGSGGMGCVYACRAPNTNETVAVKVIRADVQSAAVRRHFAQEQLVLARLTHPNLSRLREAGVTDSGAPFIVMQFIEGEPIDRFCQRQNSSVRQRLWLFSQVLAGVEYCHRQQIVHRDLKPSNILVTASNNVQILDFGIAKLVEHLPGGTGHGPTQTARPIMTFRYASPEQLTGLLSGRSSDIYSLGVILYELLTGKHPLGAGKECSRQDVVHALATRRPEPPSTACGETWPRISASATNQLDLLTMTALEKQPEHRYRTAASFIEAIGRCLDQLGAAGAR